MATAHRIGLLMSAFLVSGIQAQETPRNPANDAHISARVVSADTGAPLAGVLVELIGIRRPGAGASAGWRESRTSRSDGTFDYADIPPGDFELSLKRTGYFTRSSTQIALSARQRLPLTVTMSRTAAIAGRIVDEYGEPVAQVQVQAFAAGWRQHGSLSIVPAGIADVTDDLGQFRVYGLQPREYALAATRWDGVEKPPSWVMPISTATATLESPPTYYPGTLDPTMAQTLSLRDGQDLSVQFTVRDGRLFRLSGRAVSVDGTPLSGARVSVRALTIVGMRPGGLTAADGSFEIAGVAPGNYTVELQASGGPACSSAPCTALREHGSTNVTVTTDDVAGLSVVASGGGRLSGVVVFEGDSSGRAYPLQLQRLDGDGGPTIYPLFTLGKDGRFDAQNVFGRMTLVSADSNWVVKSVSVDGTDVLDTGIDPRGSTVSGIRVVVTDKLTTIGGRVVDQRDQPLAEHSVVLLRIDGIPPRQRDGLRTLRTSADGRFKAWGMRPGTYAAGVVENARSGSESDPDVQERVRKYGRRFTVDEGETVDLELQPTSGLR